MSITLSHKDLATITLDGPYVEDGRPTERAIRDYVSLFDRLDELRAIATDELLKLYNDQWTDELHGQLDRAAFIANLDHPEIHLDEFDFATVYFQDNDMFAGHYIEMLVDCGVISCAGLIG